ncbi:hypothetical protein [Burkholderia dolosa]|uniref:hypothetical protein n=1 Tax=Burkholderia dolosa TaxID=152500 RepID=UPI001BA4DCB6|nr:hypothetical protein [Burkholderia dolosa]
MRTLREAACVRCAAIVSERTTSLRDVTPTRRPNQRIARNAAIAHHPTSHFPHSCAHAGASETRRFTARRHAAISRIARDDSGNPDTQRNPTKTRTFRSCDTPIEFGYITRPLPPGRRDAYRLRPFPTPREMPFARP